MQFLGVRQSEEQEEILRFLVEGTAASAGDLFFDQLVRTLAEALRTKFAFVSELADPDGNVICLLSLWDGERFAEPFDYASKGTPCEQVLKQGLRAFDSGVQQLFPEDDWLVQEGIESYLAVPLYSAEGEPIGHLGVMHDQPMAESESIVSILRIFAARAGAELGRKRAEEEILRMNAQLEKRVIERTAELSEANEQLQREIRERRHAEEAKAESEAQLRLMADSLPVFIAYVDRNERYQFNNSAYERLFGLPPEDVKGKTINEVLGDVFYSTIEEQIESALQGHEGTFENEIVLANGDQRVLRAHYVPHRLGNGAVAGFFALVQDVTEERRLQATMQELRENLARVQRRHTVGELTAAIAHELNQPLASIQANAHAGQRFLTDDNPSVKELQEVFSDIIADNQRAAGVISRIRALLSNRDVDSVPVDINEVIRGVAELVRSDAAHRNVELTFELDEAMPPVLGDVVQLQQVLLNLIMNGFEAMQDTPADKRRLVIRSEMSTENFVCIVVEDSGSGFGDLDREAMWTPFHSTKADGLGMGLAISRSIITAYGGTIQAAENPAGGAIFRFGLPVSRSG